MLLASLSPLQESSWSDWWAHELGVLESQARPDGLTSTSNPAADSFCELE